MVPVVRSNYIVSYHEFFQVYPDFSKERLVYNICSRKEFVNDVRVAAFTETASQQAYLACPKPCFRRRNWVTNEDGVSVPKEAISEERLTFLCQRPASDVDEPNRDVFISFEEVITYVLRDRHRLSEVCTNRQKRTLVQDRGKFVEHFRYSLLVSF